MKRDTRESRQADVIFGLHFTIFAIMRDKGWTEADVEREFKRITGRVLPSKVLGEPGAWDNPDVRTLLALAEVFEMRLVVDFVKREES